MIDYDTLKNWQFPEIEHSYTADDTMLYALGVGMGANPLDERQLRFVNDSRPGTPLALPTMAVVLGYPGSWMRDARAGIDFSTIVHGEEGVVWHRPIPAAGTVVSKHRITHVVDKGAGRGALVTYDKDLFDKASGALLATVTHTTFCRSEGGFSAANGRSDSAPPPPSRPPDREPDAVVDLPTLPQQALIYRLLADRNPLHSDPETARRAGFERPILHGLCTWGIAARALLERWCDHEPGRLASMFARFSAPVFPGETLAVEMYRMPSGGGTRDGETTRIAFRARIRERGRIVLDFGSATVSRTAPRP